MTYDFDNAPDRVGTDSVKWARYAGRDIIPAWVADMDFSVAPEILEALRSRLDHGVYGYPTQPPASAAEATVEYLETRHAWKVDPSWLVFLPAIVPALHATIRSNSEPGASIVTHTPVYPPFLGAPQLSGRTTTRVPMAWDAGANRWNMDARELDAATPADAKVFMLCNPFNPLGRVFDRRELELIADYASRRDLTICSDEIHCDLILDETKRHIPIATLSPEVADRTVTLFAASKTYNLAGFFCGYAVIPNAARRAAFRRVIQGIAHEVNIFGFVGLEAAYRHGEPWRLALLAKLRENLALVESAAAEMPGVKIAQRTEATYLAWLDVRELGFERPREAFEEGGAGLSDGADFGGPGHVRLNFGCPTARLREILSRIRAVAAKAGR